MPAAIKGSYVALLRHGEADRRPGSPTAGELTAAGLEQARAAARHIAPLRPERVVSSDSPRARQTAACLDGPAPVVEPGLAGLRVGPRGERPLTSAGEFLELFESPGAAPLGGESLVALLGRSRSALTRAVGQEQRAAVVAHRIVNMVLICDALGLGPEAGVALQQDPGAVNVLARDADGLAPISMNVSPLDPLRLGPGGRLLPDTETRVERRVYLIRHGEAENVRAGRMWSGSASPLTVRGRRQARELGRRLAPLRDVTIVASDLPRAEETGRLLAGGRPVALNSALREISLGDLEGRRFGELFAACPGFMIDPDARPPGGESATECGDRAAAELEELLGRGEGDVVVVTHGGVQRMLAARLLGWPDAVGARLRTDWSGVTVLDRAAGRWWARCLNWTPAGVRELAHVPPVPGLTSQQARVLGRAAGESAA